MTAMTSRKMLRDFNRSARPLSRPQTSLPPAALQALQVGDAMIQRIGQVRLRKDFESLISRLMPQLQAMAMHMLRHRQDAEDAVQNALISAHVAMDRFNGDSSLETWIYRIVVNACLMKIRSRRQNRVAFFSDLDSAAGAVPMTTRQVPEAAPGCRAEARESAALVRKNVRRLPTPFRQILELRDLQEISTEETAQMLRMSQGAVRTRLHRARQALRRSLESSAVPPSTSP